MSQAAHFYKIDNSNYKTGLAVQKRSISLLDGKNKAAGLLSCQEISLAPLHNHTFTCQEQVKLIVIPLFGGVEISTISQSFFVHIHQTLQFTLSIDEPLIIENVYPENQVRLLLLCFRESRICAPQTTNYLINKPNALINIYNSETKNQTIELAELHARQDISQYIEKNTNIFIYVLAGALEVQNRLLEKGEALSLYDPGNFEMEALSNNAMVLVVKSGENE